ncbi:unnamed protein product, partial [Mesorhabditis belari]|uniref:Uncharacterized protein n=1 Tax=Mesorhabditis belari TaxID=2138241 RepID=A0AAF3FN61_9BILA
MMSFKELSLNSKIDLINSLIDKTAQQLSDSMCRLRVNEDGNQFSPMTENLIHQNRYGCTDLPGERSRRTSIRSDDTDNQASSLERDPSSDVTLRSERKTEELITASYDVNSVHKTPSDAKESVDTLSSASSSCEARSWNLPTFSNQNSNFSLKDPTTVSYDVIPKVTTLAEKSRSSKAKTPTDKELEMLEKRIEKKRTGILSAHRRGEIKGRGII